MTDLVQQQIRLRTAGKLAGGVPPTTVGEVIRLVEPAVRRSVRMAFEGRSSASGRRPKWLEAAAAVRLTGVEIGADGATLRFNAPRFVDAAPSLYEQLTMFGRLPEGHFTGFDMLAGALSRVRDDDADSDRYDSSLLSSITRFGRGIDNVFSSVELAETSNHAAQTLDGALIERARKLRDRTPSPRPVRLLATLDMVRVSTGSLGLKLDDGAEVRGVVAEEVIAEAQQHLGSRVLVHGKAVYRPSGHLLRLEVDAFEDGRNASALFARVPEPIRPSLTPQQLTGSGPQSGGVRAFYCAWPGNETEDELLAALREI